MASLAKTERESEISNECVVDGYGKVQLTGAEYDEGKGNNHVPVLERDID